MMMLDPNNNFQWYHTRDVTFLKLQYYSRDPNVSRNGRVLTIEGLDSNFIDQGSADNCHSTDPENIEIEVPSGNANNDNNQQNSQFASSNISFKHFFHLWFNRDFIF